MPACRNSVIGGFLDAENAFKKADQKMTELIGFGDGSYTDGGTEITRSVGIFGDVTITVNKLYRESYPRELLVFRKNHHWFGKDDYSVKVSIPQYVIILSTAEPFTSTEDLWFNAAIKSYVFLLGLNLVGHCPTA